MSLSKNREAQDSSTDAYNPLAVFRLLPSSPTAADILRRINVLLSSYAGMDRVMMIIQYAGPLLGRSLTKSTAFTQRLNKLSNHAGRPVGARRAAIATSISVLSSKLSDARMLGRFFGLLPIISWMLSLENKATAPKNAKVRNIQRLQAWSMLAYYPLEHAYYLAAHGIITLSAEKKLKAILWACRAWALYVGLQLVLCSEQARLLSKKMASLSQRRGRSRSHSDAPAQIAEKDQATVDTDMIVEQAGLASEDASLMMSEQECMRESEVLINGAMTNLAYAPLTVHWSLENGLFKDEIWSSVFMTIAGLSGLRASWRAIA